jgi:choline-glycine betaine transporter
MSGLTIVVAAFAVALVAMSGAFMGGAVIVAVPLAVVMIGVAAFADFNRRRKAAQTIHDHRVGSAEREVEFTDRDQRTLVSE